MHDRRPAVQSDECGRRARVAVVYRGALLRHMRGQQRHGNERVLNAATRERERGRWKHAVAGIERAVCAMRYVLPRGRHRRIVIGRRVRRSAYATKLCDRHCPLLPGSGTGYQRPACLKQCRRECKDGGKKETGAAHEAGFCHTRLPVARGDRGSAHRRIPQRVRCSGITLAARGPQGACIMACCGTAMLRSRILGCAPFSRR